MKQIYTYNILKILNLEWGILRLKKSNFEINNSEIDSENFHVTLQSSESSLKNPEFGWKNCKCDLKRQLQLKVKRM